MNRVTKYKCWFPNTQTMWTWDDCKSCTVSQLFTKDLDRKAIIQFTGLHDANGVEIYEGDIIDDGRLHEVVYSVRAAKFCVRVVDHAWSGDRMVVRSIPTKGKVVGNIYDNPVEVDTRKLC